MTDTPPNPDSAAITKCRECGYDITGLDSGICPECGAGFFVGGEGLQHLRDKLLPSQGGRCKVCGGAVQPGASKCPTCGCRLLRPA
ncbi:MAG: hypothetical protein H7210_10865 [Pyrinomonadaceae bacterium]|nr:hypothetical protein [Phycisphaerales bacterium]